MNNSLEENKYYKKLKLQFSKDLKKPKKEDNN
jgi:hypothetical protein